jgi:hypothetical protein
MKSTRAVSAPQSRRASDATEMYTLSRAKAHLGRLLEKSERGATVYILKGHRRFLLQPVHEIEPIPLRPPGYFEFDAEDVRLDAQFAKANVVPMPDRE